MISNEEVFVISMCIYGLRFFPLRLPLHAFVYLCHFIAWQYIFLFLDLMCARVIFSLSVFSSFSFFINVAFMPSFPRHRWCPFSQPTAQLSDCLIFALFALTYIYISFYTDTYKIELNVFRCSRDIHIVVSLLFVVVCVDNVLANGLCAFHFNLHANCHIHFRSCSLTLCTSCVDVSLYLICLLFSFCCYYSFFFLHFFSPELFFFCWCLRCMCFSLS